MRRYMTQLDEMEKIRRREKLECWAYHVLLSLVYHNHINKLLLLIFVIEIEIATSKYIHALQ